MNCVNFDMNECNFSEKIMNIKDKNGLSREGSGRVAIHKDTGLVHCYTLECNYHNGRRINMLSPKQLRSNGNIEAESAVTDPQSKIYQNVNSPPFTIEIFEDVGKAVCYGILDLIEDNPVSRIPQSCYKTVQNVRTDIELNVTKYESGNVNIPGANHFRASNSKIASAYAASTKTGQTKLMTNQAIQNKNKCGTFGTSKRLANDELKEVKVVKQ